LFFVSEERREQFARHGSKRSADTDHDELPEVYETHFCLLASFSGLHLACFGATDDLAEHGDAGEY